MQYRTLGRTGIKVSPYALGAMMFGAIGNPNHDDSIRIIHKALDAGINFVDTADAYSRGESEEIVGKALMGRRDDIVLATKLHLPMGDDPNQRGNSRRWIIAEVENSLRRLQTDYIDLYQIHRPDPDTDIEETLSALSDLIAEARVRAVKALPERRVGAEGQQGGQPRADPVQDCHSLLGGGDLDVDVAAAGELLVRGQAEGLGHTPVTPVVDHLGFDGNRRGAQRRHLASGPPGRGHREGPAPAQLAVKIAEGVARLRIGFQLLLLEFELQFRRVVTGLIGASRLNRGLPRCPQDRARHRLRLPGPRFDEQEFLFNAHAARIHRPMLPPDPALNRERAVRTRRRRGGAGLPGPAGRARVRAGGGPGSRIPSARRKGRARPGSSSQSRQAAAMAVSRAGSTRSGADPGPVSGTVVAWKAVIRCRSRDGSICWSLVSARSELSSSPATLPVVAVCRLIATATASSSSSSSGGSAAPTPSR